MKKILLFCAALTLALFSAHASDYYTSFEVSSSQNMPNSVLVEGAECDNTQCSEITQRDVTLYSGEARTCLEQGLNGDINSNEFESCIQQYKIEDNLASTSDNEHIVTKIETPSDFGYLTYFSASNDQYLPYYYEQNNFNCDFDVCIDNGDYDISFEKKDGAIAEIGKVNIKNTNDDKKPIQVEVPVEIEQSVCSAFTKTLDEGTWQPQIPDPYSDFYADTRVDIEIRDKQNNELLHDDQVFLSIAADECASFAAFEWTPESNLENEDVSISLTTDVIDNQVINSIQDNYEVEETVYPEDLENACWTRIEDFELTNDPNKELTSSLAQISEGEKLFAKLKAGSFRGENNTPMDYDLQINAGGEYFYAYDLSSSQELQEQIINLTEFSSSLDTGDYEVEAKATPSENNGCEISESTTHTQQLTILENMEYDLEVIVRDENRENIENAEVNLDLIDAKEEFAQEPQYNETKFTSTNGSVEFNSILAGDYQYEIGKEGFSSKIDTLRVGSDMTMYVTLTQDNNAPVINLPDDRTVSINEGLKLDLRNYISDANEDFSTLNVQPSKTQGVGELDYNNGYLTLNSTQEGTGQFSVEVEDSQGSTSEDSININFTKNNEPEITQFVAQPDNGEAPFETTFFINVDDNNNQDLTCTIDFDDSNSVTRDCSDMDQINHTFQAAKTYNPTLEVSNEDFTTTAQTQVVVFTREIPDNNNPVINEFSANPSSGQAPLDTNFTIDVEDNNNDNLTCTINFGDSNSITRNCNNPLNESYTYQESGNYEASIEVSDGQSITYQEITINVLQGDGIRNYTKLNANSVGLNIDDNIQPGEFEFSVNISNETLDRRELTFRPELVCDETTNSLSNNNGELPQRAISSSQRNGSFHYQLSMDTQDFKNNIPKNTICDLNVKISDDINTTITKSEDVEFNYQQEEENIASIRGTTTDIMSYMDTSLQNSVEGYNSNSFVLINNEDETKDIKISMISAELGINKQIEIGLDPNTQREESISYFVPSGTNSGNHPLRISINDGENQQTRYSYIYVE